jgi:tetratricopeptide (TPR) repeat protein
LNLKEKRILSFLRSRKLEQARTSASLALASEPNSVIALNALAVIAAFYGQTEVARNYWYRVLELDPTNIDASTGLLNLFIESRDWLSASNLLLALPIAAGSSFSWDLASIKVLHGSGSFALCLERCEQAIAAFGEEGPQAVAKLHFFAALCLNALGLVDESIKRLREAMHLDPSSSLYVATLADAHFSVGDYCAAIAAYQRALSKDPSGRGYAINYANALLAFGMPFDAVTILSKALHSDSTNAAILNNLGKAYADSQQWVASIEAYSHTLEVDPDYPEAYLGRGLIRMKLGLWDDGLRDFDYRWLSAGLTSQRFITSRPRWSGGSGVVFLSVEQGIGDQIMFLQTLNFLKGLGEVSFKIAVDRRLHAVLRAFATTTFAFSLLEHIPADNEFDFHLHGADVFAVVHSLVGLESLASRQRPNLLSVPTGEVLLCREEPDEEFSQLALDKRLRVGVSWKSGNILSGYRRTIPISELLDNLPDCHEYFSVQYHAPTIDGSQPMLECSPKLSIIEGLDARDDLRGLVRALAGLDLLVTIDNSVAHFAGCLGIPTILLLDFSCDWRWGTDSSTSIWYPSITILRQRRPGDWSDVLASLKQMLITKNPSHF